MSTFLERYTFRHGDSDFWQRVETALLNTADTLLAEASNTTNHANRVAWATALYATPDALAATVHRLKNRISQNWKVVEVGSAIPDTGQDALQDVVNAVVTISDMPQA